MRIALLHLSDFHFKSNEDNPVLSRVQQVATATVPVIRDTRFCFVAVTGDVAFSGQSTEYTLANEFFTRLKEHLTSKLQDCTFHFVFVPGNHDCDFSDENTSQAKKRNFWVENLTREKLDPSYCEDEDIIVQDNYEDFVSNWRSKDLSTEESSRVCRREFYELPEITVEFLLINSAWISRKKEIQGSLLFPTQFLQPSEGREYADSELVITMLHHPYKWFESSTSRELSKELEKVSDVVLTGHEHDGDFYTKTRPTSSLDQSLDYLEGQVFQTSNDPEQSLFNVLVIDTTQKQKKAFTFSWTKEEQYYRQESSTGWRALQRNSFRLRSEFVLKEEFEKNLRDAGASFWHPRVQKVLLDDVFVFPDFLKLSPLDEDQWTVNIVSGRDLLTRRSLIFIHINKINSAMKANKLILNYATNDIFSTSSCHKVRVNCFIRFHYLHFLLGCT